jgi:hypothetical protein
MDLCGTVYHGYVVSKHLAHFDNGNPKVSKSVAEINDLNACPGSNKLRPIGSRLDSSLLFGVPINRCSIEKVKYPSDCSSCQDIMVQVSINIMGENHLFPKGGKALCTVVPPQNRHRLMHPTCV